MRFFNYDKITNKLIDEIDVIEQKKEFPISIAMMKERKCY